MSDVSRKETPVSQLEMGMFVTALDRPWLGTPFMLEGLLLEAARTNRRYGKAMQSGLC